MKDCIFCKIDPLTNNTFIKSYDHWTLLLNFKQPTLGSSLIVPKRHLKFLSEITDEEAEEGMKVIREYEEAIRLSFNPDKINHLMLANINSHVHYHSVPRYEREKVFAGRQWVDKNYGTAPLLKTRERNPELLEYLVKSIRERLH